MKISELAKELGKDNKTVLAKAKEVGIEAKSAAKSIKEDEIKKIKDAFNAKPKITPGMPNIPFGAGPNPPMGKVVISKEIEARTIDKNGNIIKSKEELDKKAKKDKTAIKETTEKTVKKTLKENKEEAKKVAEKVKNDLKEAKKEVEEKVNTIEKAEKIKNTTEEIGIKIIKKAEDVRREEMTKAEEIRAKRAEQRKAKNQKEKKDSKPNEHKKQLKTRKFGTDNRKQDDRKNGRKPEGPRHFDNNDAQPMETKRNGRGRKNKEKDKERFDRFDDFSGKKSKKAMKHRSLEKAAKPKKHKDYKQQVEEPEEEEIIPEGTKVISVPITVAGFCEQTEVSKSKVIMELMKLGIMANINQNLDEDTCELLGAELGIELIINKAEEKIVEEGIEDFEDRESDLQPRPPIITVMGHVDHGKTSLLDAIRNTNVIEGESGGITQHIGASEVEINGKKIVFLDTPGHEAFTAMRARGAMVTDIAVLVVAADDSVKPQTVESISHAKAAGVPIIVAINKIDKPGANIDKVKQDLSEHGILVEDWGGDVISVPVSAKKNEGIVQLLEMILLQADVLELKANPDRLALGTVIEARLDKAKGPVASLLVTNGTLKAGSSIVVGTCSGRIRLMTNHKGETIRKAGPTTPVEVLGLNDVPQAGDEFNAVRQDKIAKEIAEKRKNKLREEVLAKNSSTSLEQLFGQIKDGEVKDLNLIIKGDVQGSVGAIVSSLEKLNNENVKVNVVHTGVGTVNESDVSLATTTNAVIVGFNVRPTTAVQTMADREGVEIRLYRVIYDIINDVEDAMKGMLEPEFKEEVLGKADVRNTFKVPSVGVIAGAYVTEGKVVRKAEIRLVRDGIVVHEGTISSLKRFKDDAKEVAKDFECGIGIENYNDIKEGDVIECFHMVEIEKE